MADRIFLDANVVLDHWLNNEPGQADAESILNSISGGVAQACISIGVLQIIYFLSIKEKKENWVRKGIQELLKSVRLVDATSNAVDRALSSSLRDLEDAIHLETAELHFCTHFITSDKALLRSKHGLAIRCISPADYLKHLAS